MSSLPAMAPDDPAGTLPWSLRYRVMPVAGTRLRLAWVRWANRHADVSFGPRCRLGPGFHLDVPGPGRFRAGRAVDFRRHFVCEIGGSGSVEIGDSCVFTFGAVIQCSTTVVIEPGCSIGAGALVVDGSHRFRDHTVPMRQQGFDYRPVTIGRGATVSAHATVLADVGPGAFVGAGAVVTSPVPAFCLAVGAPARAVEYFGPPGEGPEGVPVR